MISLAFLDHDSVDSRLRCRRAAWCAWAAARRSLGGSDLAALVNSSVRRLEKLASPDSMGQRILLKRGPDRMNQAVAP